MTLINGSVVKGPRGSYEAYAVGLANKANFGPMVDLLAVHADVSFTDCNNIAFKFDFFGGYSWNTLATKTPFLDPPDFVPVPPPFTETYRRMPTVCKVCVQ
jgi:hypothetical protein